MKFPRTPHLPGSRGTDDDLYTDYSYDGEVIILEKLDGSNIMMNSEKFITRKGSTSTAEWTFPVRNLHYQIQHLIPQGLWLAGELMYWRKTIAYENLPAPYILFGAINEDTVLGWDDVVKVAEQVELPLSPVLAQGSFKDAYKTAMKAYENRTAEMEGFVIRPYESFSLSDYQDYVAKWVNSDYTPTALNNGVNGILPT